MKRILLVLCYSMACVALISCSNDQEEITPNHNKQQVYADTPADPIDGQNGQTPITPPKP